MSLRSCPAVLVLMISLAAPSAAWAFGFAGCPNLPDYNRALGTLQGMTVCGMTIEQARRVIAAHDGSTIADRQVAPAYQAHHRRDRRPPRHRAAHHRRPAVR